MLTLDITAAGLFVGSNTGYDWSSVTCTCGKCLNDTQNSNLISYRFRSQQFRHFHTLIILSTQSSQNKIICTDYNKGDKSIYIFMTNELWQNWWDPNHASILHPVTGPRLYCCGCWVLDTAVVDVDTGVWRQARQRRRRHRGQESCSGHPPTVAVATALRELRAKYTSIKYLTTF